MDRQSKSGIFSTNLSRREIKLVSICIAILIALLICIHVLEIRYLVALKDYPEVEAILLLAIAEVFILFRKFKQAASSPNLYVPPD